MGNWERKKEIHIIGEEYFKFKVDLIVDNDLDEEVEIDWILEIFCIHSDYLLKRIKTDISKNMNQHYFINCDCDGEENESCHYISKNNSKNIIDTFNLNNNKYNNNINIENISQTKNTINLNNNNNKDNNNINNESLKKIAKKALVAGGLGLKLGSIFV